jgi:Lecithin retinol acyltransferase
MKIDDLAEFLRVGDHLVTSRAGGAYKHHGIYVGDGRVVHYSGFSDVGEVMISVVGKEACYPVEDVSLVDFSKGIAVNVKRHKQPIFQGQDVAERARSRIGESKYSVLSNNCEHFCEWCINDTHVSWQVRKTAQVASAISGASLAGVATRIAIPRVAMALGGGTVLGSVAGPAVAVLATGYTLYQAGKWMQSRNIIQNSPAETLSDGKVLGIPIDPIAGD